MRSALDSINQRNRNDQPFTVQDVEPYVSYFDRHGTDNDRMLAHYLLGRAYHEQGEAPMALQCYQEAITAADTASKDCDFAQLSRVYSQMGCIYYQQNLFYQQINSCHKAISYSCIADDSLSAISNYEQLANAYERLNNYEKAKSVIDSVAKWYERHGYLSTASIAKGRAAVFMVLTGKYEEAKKYMQLYERHSGLFNQHGDIAKGREIYYYFKGLVNIHYNCFDTAEYYFRKELYLGKDFNNQNAASRGLAMLFEKRNMPDSAAKYYKYSYAMNDSLYAQMTTLAVGQMQAIYNYARSQKEASEKAEEAKREKKKRELYVKIFVFSTLLLCIYIFWIYRQRRNGLYQYEQTLKELRQIRAEKQELSQHKSDYEQLIAQKEETIYMLERRMTKYGKQIYFNTANAERCLKESPTYKHIEKLAIKGQNLSDEEWDKINILVREYLPEFDDFMATHSHLLKSTEYRICLLLRLHLKAIDIAHILNISKSQVSQMCSDIMRKIFSKKGSSKELSLKLSHIF